METGYNEEDKAGGIRLALSYGLPIYWYLF